MKKITLFLIDFYQKFLSFDKGVLAIFAPGGACKFSPSCSEYTQAMVEEKGVIVGLRLGVTRLITCR